MGEELIYSLRFGLRGKTMSDDQVTTKQVPFERLLDCFDAALAWVEANLELRFADVHGPGMMTRNVDPHTREYITGRLPEELAKKHRQYIGLAWIDLDGDRTRCNYRLFKIWAADRLSPEDPDTPTACYGLAEVDPRQVSLAFEWAQAHRWKDEGIWFGGKPGLVFCPDFAAITEAFTQIAELAEHLETGELERAPVRCGWGDYEDAYPRMRPTRSTAKIHKLRAQYPTAGYDLKVTPLSVLIRRFGYSRVRV